MRVDPYCICRAEQDCLEGRSERPVTGTGSPEPRERLRIKRDSYDSLPGRAEHVAGRLRDFKGSLCRLTTCTYFFRAKRPGAWMPRPRYFLIRSRTVMPDGIIGKTCS